MDVPDIVSALVPPHNATAAAECHMVSTADRNAAVQSGNIVRYFPAQFPPF